MPETNRRDEPDYGRPEIHEPAANLQKPGAAPSPKGENATVKHEEDTTGFEESEASSLHYAEVPEGDDISGFADDVVSGLEHAVLEVEESDAEESDAVISTSEEEVLELPVETPEGFFAGWDGLEAEEPEPAAHEPASGENSLRSLSEMTFLADQPQEGELTEVLTDEDLKHNELADAVQSALLSLYGGGGDRASLESQQDLYDQDESRTTPQRSDPKDALSPQEMILNYFDYTPGRTSTIAGDTAQFAGAGSGAAYPNQAPLAFPGAAGSPHNYSAQAAGWQVPQRQGVNYDGPPSYPVPAGPALPSRPAAVRDRGNSRLLGAAAGGLVGGIAIAASLAAFLIYGAPRQTTVNIPGVGSLRLDKDEPGYGGNTFEEALAEPQGTLAAPSIKMRGEVMAMDAFAEAGKPAPLAISIKSQQPFEQMLISIAGIPEGGRLSAGVDAGEGNWLLPPRRLNGLTLTLPSGAPDMIPLEAQLLDSSGKLPVSAKAQFTVRITKSSADLPSSASTNLNSTPNADSAGIAVNPATRSATPFNTQIASQPSPSQVLPSTQSLVTEAFRAQTIPTATQQQPAVAPFQASIVPSPVQGSQERTAHRTVSRPEVDDLVREGNKRMREGDIIEARQLYQKAVGLGDPEAALAMGRSYDPIYFARIEKKNAEPDPAKAFDWYRKAMDGGASQTAMVRIENLKHFLNE
ncbi:MAG: hypothetical protein WBX25_18290 [Rhodomicrobium sp.]